MESKFKLLGAIDFRIYNADGSLDQRVVKKNLVVTNGLGLAVSRLSSNGSNALSHMGIGSGTLAPTLADTDLQTSIVRRVFDTAGGSVVGSVVTYYCTYPAGTGTGTISEAGLFNALAAGTMFSRITFPPMTKSASQSLAASWTVTAVGA